MAAVNASRNRFIVCRQCLKIRGDTPCRMRVILGPSIRGFLLFALSPRANWEGKKKKRVARSPVNRRRFRSLGNRAHRPLVSILSSPLLGFFLRVQRTRKRHHRAYSTTIIGLSAILEKRTSQRNGKTFSCYDVYSKLKSKKVDS